jgi:hypothetical protein
MLKSIRRLELQINEGVSNKVKIASDISFTVVTRMAI